MSQNTKSTNTPKAIIMFIVIVAVVIFVKVNTVNSDSTATTEASSSVLSSESTQQTTESTSAQTLPEATPTPETTPEPTPTPMPTAISIIGVADATGQTFYGKGTPNNKIGMYVNNNADDIKAAAKLINSNGGKWGYVLLTMDVNDRSVSNWQELFDAAKKSQLIPIVQLFNNSICKPDKLNFKELADTLNKVKWPTKYRYISVFNEVNSKDYWCENISPSEYATDLNNAIKEFKAKSSNFFIMPAAFNSSARTQDRYMSEDTFLIKMNQAVPGIFTKIDGWATHAYPQPNFSGDISNLSDIYGDRDSITNYLWEMSLLKNNFGVSGLPIFITETGWLHKEGQNGCVQYSQSNLLSADTVSSRYKNAYLNYWLKNPQIVAITPFIFKSSDKCAAGFTWQKSDGSWYPQANMLMGIAKTSGTP